MARHGVSRHEDICPGSFWDLGDPAGPDDGGESAGAHAVGVTARRFLRGVDRHARSTAVALAHGGWRRGVAVIGVLASTAVFGFGIWMCAGAWGTMNGGRQDDSSESGVRSSVAASTRTGERHEGSAKEAPRDSSDSGRSAGSSAEVHEGSIAAMPDASWVRAVADATGIPEDYVRAYAGASLDAANRFPSCGVGWNMLAGIGFVESGHGSGKDVAMVYGPTLDGRDGVGAVPDSDGGSIDGDERWDRAVGPMQFLPSTWMRYAVDGDGDGVRDPMDIYDAAPAAADYLCTAGGDLTVDGNWIAAVEAYNRGDEYNEAVAQAAQKYADQSDGLQ